MYVICDFGYALVLLEDNYELPAIIHTTNTVSAIILRGKTLVPIAIFRGRITDLFL